MRLTGKLLALATAAMLGSAPAMASETLTASFTTPDGGVTAGKYSGQVQVTVSGIGQSLGTDYNDAFYVFADSSGALVGPTNYQGPDWYQLAFGTSALVAFDSGNAAYLSLVGGLPSYNPDHVYTFDLNTGTTTPSVLHFGVTDGNFGDNSGAYSITVTQLGGAVPEPATWALMLLGFGMVGAGMRKRTNVRSLNLGYAFA